MELIDFIICDDIRFEVGGKRSLIGVVEDTFNLPAEENDKWPKSISFGLSIRGILSPEETEKDPKSFELMLKIGDELKGIGKGPLPAAPVTQDKPKKIALAVVFKNMTIEKPGKLTAILIVRDKNEEIIAQGESKGSIMIQSVAIKPGTKEPVDS